MQPTQTGIAVALALAVVAVFFIFPGLWPFGGTSPAAQGTQATTTTMASTTDQSSTTTPSTTATMDLTAQPTDKLEVTDESVGTGAVAQSGDKVTVEYVGALTDGQIFDASSAHAQTKDGFTFTLGAGQVIQGWDQGVAGMKVGGVRKLVIPASLGYGAQGAGSVIPPNATLVFQVKLLDVQKP